MKNADTFSTFSGFCHVLPEYLVITTDGNPKTVLRQKERNSYEFRLFIMAFALLTLAAAYFFLSANSTAASVCLLAAAGCFVSFLRWKGKSDTQLIDRKTIYNIQLVNYRKIPTFVIAFKDARDRYKTRDIKMKSDDAQALAKAFSLFVENGLIPAEGNSVVQKTVLSMKQAETGKTTESTPLKKQASSSKTGYKRDASGYLKDY